MSESKNNKSQQQEARKSKPQESIERQERAIPRNNKYQYTTAKKEHEQERAKNNKQPERNITYQEPINIKGDTQETARAIINK